MKSLIQIKSINCESCAAPLIKHKGSCQCSYCGSLNIILLNGKTQIAVGDYYVDGKNINPPKLERKEKAIDNWKLIFIGAGVFLVCGACLYYFFMKRKAKENLIPT